MLCNPFGRRKTATPKEESDLTYSDLCCPKSADSQDAQGIDCDPGHKESEGPDPFHLGPLSLRCPYEAQENPTGEQVALLRRELNKAKLDWYLVFSDDSHASESPAPCDQRREYVTGFTGSAGTALVGEMSAHLFTDGRYWIQAGQQLDGHWTLHKVGSPEEVNWDTFLISVLKPGERVGFDATTVGYAVAKDLIVRIEQAGGRVRLPAKNLVDLIWKGRPAPRKEPIYEHPLKYSGEKAADKIVRLTHFCREYVARQRQVRQDPLFGSHGFTYVVTALDEVAWLLNLRGDSVPFTPVFPAYVTLANVLAPGQNTPRILVTLYVDWDLVPTESKVLSYLQKELGAHVAQYQDIWTVIQEPYEEHHVLLAAPQASWAVAQAWRGKSENLVVLSSQDNWIAQTKASKNATELAGLRAAYLRDGAAWVRWISHLERDLQNGTQVNEWQAAERLMCARQKDPLYKGESYGPISASGGNAALPHYEPSKDESQVIDPRTPYLCDAGGQYLDGTIDTTRTTFFYVGGTRPTSEHQRAFTRVLQGHISLDQAKFPQGTSGAQLDALARQALFQDGYNYNHGTGHGVGAFLGVHEGPQGFGSTFPFAPGHIISNEPGFYEETEFGIRIESVLEVVEAQTHRQFGGGKWLEFSRLTVVPIDARLVDFALLTPTQATWLRQHNDTCKAKLLPLVRDDAIAVQWLLKQ